MMLSKILCLISLAVVVISCEQPQITGHWKRVWPDSAKSNQAMRNDEGDLTLNADSTYFIKGNLRKSKADTLLHWHDGIDESGTWEMRDSNQIFLHCDSTRKMMYRPFEIMYLSKKMLILHQCFDSLYLFNYVRD